MANGIIRPGRVEPGSWKKWLRQGLELVWRFPLFWLALMGVLDYALRYGGIFQPILLLFTFSLGFNAAVAVDQEAGIASVLQRFYALGSCATFFSLQIGAMVLALALPVLAFLLLTQDAMALMLNLRIPFNTLAELSEHLNHYLRDVGDGLFLWGGFAVVGYVFIYPLRTMGVEFPLALVYAVKAHFLNLREFIMIGVSCAVSVILADGYGLQFLEPLLYAFWMAVNYVMFREVFLGMGENCCHVKQRLPQLQPAVAVKCQQL